ncbi:MAG: hypothetical protein FWD39_03845, partial [Clostridiales bacterium]|nr:hypothetical protein [Clostridiales bacterium]
AISRSDDTVWRKKSRKMGYEWDIKQALSNHTLKINFCGNNGFIARNLMRLGGKCAEGRTFWTRVHTAW